MTGQSETPGNDGELRVATGLPVLPTFTALAEIAVLFGLIYLLDQLIPNSAILEMSPHPFWIPVLLVSLQYGTVSGFIAAATAIALAMFAGLPEQDVGENLFAFFLRVWGQPILWISVALLVGQFRMRQLAAKQELRHQNSALVRQRDDLARHASELRRRVERLEQELVARHSTSPHVGLAALAKTIADGGIAANGTPQEALKSLAIAVFPSACMAAYRLEDGTLTEYSAFGRKPDTGPRIRITRDDPLFAAVIEQGRTVSVLDRAGTATLAGAGLLAVPISSRDSDAPFGMLVVEMADPAVLEDDGIRAVELMASGLAPRPPQAVVARDTTGDMQRIRHLRQNTPVSVRADGPKAAADVTKPRATGLVQRLARVLPDKAAVVITSTADEPGEQRLCDGNQVRRPSEVGSDR